MAVCCQNLPLGALSSRSALSVLVGELFKKFGLFLNTGVYGQRMVLGRETVTKFENVPHVRKNTHSSRKVRVYLEAYRQD